MILAKRLVILLIPHQHVRLKMFAITIRATLLPLNETECVSEMFKFDLADLKSNGLTFCSSLLYLCNLVRFEWSCNFVFAFTFITSATYVTCRSWCKIQFRTTNYGRSFVIVRSVLFWKSYITAEFVVFFFLWHIS